MAKDPAFLFYPNDWLGGTLGMSFEEKGAYMDLLMMQFNRGHMEGHMIGQVVGQIWDKIKHKFKQDENGLWYNERLEIEKEKRKSFTASRKNNLKGVNQYTKKAEKKEGHKEGHMTSHMENENEIENIVIILNEILNSNYKSKSEKTKKLIRARLNEGFSIDDFRSVITFKNKQWGSDAKMREFLRPETLFSNKFESYLQASKINSNPPVKMQY